MTADGVPQARPVSWKYSFGIFTSRRRCSVLNGGRWKATKPASRMLNQALAVGCEMPQSSASEEWAD